MKDILVIQFSSTAPELIGTELLCDGLQSSPRLPLCDDDAGRISPSIPEELTLGFGGKPIHNSGSTVNEMGNPGPKIDTGDAKVSFRDKLIGDSTVKTLAFADTLLGEKVAKIESNTEDDIPMVTFTEEA
ncbi:hypothetical protein PIB30_074797 [Stylosanthes scabra]|uniref:Uncharacterized protein n=1 Tax=Stylosanthes scabra TaxID=79078 RepID=A0ABU6RPN2_9FABA|nr:hypothetical protein [Stylosanthes scabra]